MKAQKSAKTVFELQAHLGMTKHLGGFDATEELIALCHIQRGSTVLDVGCGAGATSCRLAKHYGCVVVGVDILERMVYRAQERAGREGVSNRAIFQVADAQALPFEDNLFDAVITESVTAFPADKQQAINEYPAELRKDLEAPRFYPPFWTLNVDDEGRIWVYTSERTADREKRMFDVFDTEGKYILKVALKASPHIFKNKMYCIEEDEDGFRFVKRYNIVWRISG